ncbi:hypothetical protein P8767_12015 [Peribacillus frigoritolerans]|nr:hypothetical protein [Peribacillus frigoritolerans]
MGKACLGETRRSKPRRLRDRPQRVPGAEINVRIVQAKAEANGVGKRNVPFIKRSSRIICPKTTPSTP